MAGTPATRLTAPWLADRPTRHKVGLYAYTPVRLNACTPVGLWACGPVGLWALDGEMPKGAAAIRALADALMERGEVECEEIGAIFRAAYDGRECRFGAWDAHWPPTLDQLRTGFIPERL